MKKILLTLGLMLATVNAFANTTIENVTIKLIGYDKNIPDAILIKTDKPASQQTRISCHTDTNWNFLLKMSTPLEDKMYAALLSAQASKQNLTLVGSGVCDASYSAIESLHIIYAGEF